MHLGPSPQDEEIVRGEIEYKKEKQNLLPVYKPGDRYPLFGAITGIIAGIVITVRSGNIFLIAGGIIGGGIAGAILGSIVGALIARYRNQRKDNLRYY